MNHSKQILLAAASLIWIVNTSPAALNAYAKLTANGNALDGETTLNEIGQMDVARDHLELIALTHEIFTPFDSGAPAGRPLHTPLKFVKRVDKASPALQKAHSRDESVEGEIKLFRPNPQTGQIEHYFSIHISQGRISGIRTWFPNNLDAAAGNYPFLEEVSIIYAKLKFVNVADNTEFEWISNQ